MIPPGLYLIPGQVGLFQKSTDLSHINGPALCTTQHGTCSEKPWLPAGLITLFFSHLNRDIWERKMLWCAIAPPWRQDTEGAPAVEPKATLVSSMISNWGHVPWREVSPWTAPGDLKAEQGCPATNRGGVTSGGLCRANRWGGARTYHLVYYGSDQAQRLRPWASRKHRKHHFPQWNLRSKTCWKAVKKWDASPFF